MSDLFRAPDVSDRLLLGLAPPPTLAHQIAVTAQRLRGDLRLAERGVEPGRLYLNLNGLGDHVGLRRDLVQMAAEAAEAAPRPGPIDLRFDRAQVRFSAEGGMDLVLRNSTPLPALSEFQQALGHSMARSGLGRLVDHRFEPEIVIVRNVRTFGEAQIEPIGWMATSMVLLHVLLGRPEMVPLARWSLLPNAAAVSD